MHIQNDKDSSFVQSVLNKLLNECECSERNDLPLCLKQAQKCLACRVPVLRNMAVLGGAIYRTPVSSLRMQIQANQNLHKKRNVSSRGLLPFCGLLVWQMNRASELTLKANTWIYFFQSYNETLVLANDIHFM